MYDFSMLKGRLQQQLTDVASTAKWNPTIVCIIQQLLRSYKYMQEVQKLQWQQHQRMTAK